MAASENTEVLITPATNMRLGQHMTVITMVHSEFLKAIAK